MNTSLFSFVQQYFLSNSQHLVNNKSDDFQEQSNLLEMFRIRVFSGLTDYVWHRKHSYNDSSSRYFSAENLCYNYSNKRASAHATDYYVLQPFICIPVIPCPTPQVTTMQPKSKSFVLRNRAAVSLFLNFWGLQWLLSDPKVGRKLLLGQKNSIMGLTISQEGGQQKKKLKIWWFEHDIQGVPKFVLASINHFLHLIT